MPARSSRSELHLDGVKAVFFDAVGTLLFPEPDAPRIYAQTAAQFGLNLDPADILTRFRDAVYSEEAIDRERGWITSEAREVERWQTIVAAALPGSSDACFQSLFRHFGEPTSWRLPDDTLTVFDALTAHGIRLGMASNYDSRLETVLDGWREFDRLRERIVISSRVGVRKPSRVFFSSGDRRGEVRTERDSVRRR